jgi:hypothetical protein
MKLRRRLKAGEWVEILSKEEILRTLDEKGELDGLPFMPEMFAYCGMKFRVHKRGHKTCDTVFPVRGRWVHSTVHLTTRCSGEAHGGCQAGCLLFWKEAWLRRVETPEPVRHGAIALTAPTCTEADVYRATATKDGADSSVTYVCQATRLPYFSRDLAWWDLRQYIEDYTSGNVSLRRLLTGFIYSLYYNVAQSRLRLARPMERLYDLLSPLWGGPKYPRKRGRLPIGTSTPSASLDLQPGDLVRVKSHEAILETLTADSKNRGMLWDAELVPYCGGTYRVLKRVTKIIDERSGKMVSMKNPCIILDQVVCQSRYSACRMFCPRAIYPYWREIWLDRVEPN